MQEERASKASILIVEDEESLRTNLKFILTRKGFETEEAATGQEGLEKAQERFFNVAILDIKLPDMDGTDLVEPLKEMHPDMALIVTTGHASLDSAIKALNEGASAYVTKPLDMDDVLGRIQEFVEKQHLASENRKLYQQAQREIEERKRSEEALRKSEGHLATAQQIAHVGSWDWDLITGEVIWSDETYRILGYEPQEIEASFETLKLLTHSDDWGRVDATVQKAFAGGGSFEVEYRIIRPDQTIRNINGIGKTTFDRKGNAIHSFGTFQDITDRKRAEEALRESEEKHRVLFEHAPDLIIVMDAESRNILDVNAVACELLGYTREELLKMPIDDVYAPFAPGQLDQIIRQLEETGGTVFEHEYRRKDGSVFSVDISSRTIELSGRTLYQGYIRDLTERKRLEAQFQLAQKMEAVGTLAGGIAHNFNNLLQMIMSNISVLLMETGPSHSQHKILSAIKNRVNSGAELTKQLLGFARGGKYQSKLTNVNTLLVSATNLIDRTHKEIAVFQEFEPALWNTMVDEGQIEQVLLNLFVNSQQAMPHGGKMIVQSENVTLEESFSKLHDVAQGKYIRLTVTDTGIGMDQKTLGKIFEPFFTTKEVGQGTGLGLASAYGIIKNHDGIITVDSEVGKGTTFNIYLPAIEETAEIEQSPKAESHKGKGTILFVDDDEDLVAAARRTLEIFLAYDVFTAKSGAEAIEIYSKNENEVDLVILDLIMPEMGGGETFDKLRELNPKVKVLLSSGYSLEGEAAEVMERGCNGFIQKPFGPEELSGKILEVLGQK